MVSREYSDWVEASGIRLHGIRAAHVVHGWRGVVATEAIQPGTTLLQVPARLLMSARSAQRDPRLAAVLAAHRALTPEQVGPHGACMHACGVLGPAMRLHADTCILV